MSNPAFKPKGTPQAIIANHFTIADMMKSAGYATALAGKWQLPGELPTLINDCGFDEYRMWAYDGNLPKGVTHPAHEKGGNASRYWQPSLVENGKYLPTKPDDFGPDLFNEFVLDFARRHKNEPFYVHYTSVLTHTPRVETPDPNHPGKRWPAGLKSNLEYLDVLMGRLVDGLKAEGLDKNTYIMFIGDNGTGGDGKATVTELGARVPGIVYGPGLKRGLVSPAVADLTDIMATAAELSGAQLPTDRPFDGKSFWSVVTGKQPRHREWIYSHLDAGRLIRDERWLLQIPMRGNDVKFFDCGACRDGSTYKDVTDSNDPEVKAARARFDSIVASLPEPKPNEGFEDTTKKERKGERKEKKKAKKGKDE
jgi:arylsulfatase A